MYLRIALFIFASISYHSGWGNVTIRGKIIGYDGKSIIYYHPTIEGVYTPYWKEVKPSSNGTFRIEFENEGYGNTKISYKKICYRFFHDTNSQIYFEVQEQQDGKITRNKSVLLLADSLKQVLTIKIDGDYKEINKFYNKNLRSSYSTTHLVSGNYYSRLVSNAETPSSALAILDSLTQIEINQISQLPRTIELEDPNIKKKEKKIRDFLINEVHSFYSAIFLNAMFLKRKDHIIKTTVNSTVEPEPIIYNRDWEFLIERLNEEAKSNIKPSPNSPDYIDFIESMAYALANYKQYDFPQNPTTSLDEELTNRLFKYDTTLFYDKNARFAYELSGIQRFLNDQLYYSPVLLHAVYDLQNKYPSSSHFDFYKTKIEKLKHSLEVSKKDFRNAKIIRSDYDLFGDLLKRFEGKNILIDIWTTWCHPCIEEFKHKAMLQPFIESNKIEILYISIDKPQWEDRWRQSIKINELQGNHFRADGKFIEDMWNAIGDSKGAIPRFVIIDKEGKVFKSTAARPSEGNELIQQIELLIN